MYGRNYHEEELFKCFIVLAKRSRYQEFLSSKRGRQILIKNLDPGCVTRHSRVEGSPPNTTMQNQSPAIPKWSALFIEAVLSQGSL